MAGARADARADAVAIPPGDPGPLLNGRGGQARPVRILVTGDSTAEVMGAGLVEWAAQHRVDAQVTVNALGGCGLVRGGRFGDFLNNIRDACDAKMGQEIPASYEALRPDVAARRGPPHPGDRSRGHRGLGGAAAAGAGYR